MIARRDKYEKDLKEYWVDTHTEGNLEHEREESFQERTSIEGQAADFELGMADGPLDLVNGQTHDESDDNNEDDLDDDTSSRAPKADCEKESALEVRGFKKSSMHMCNHFQD